MPIPEGFGITESDLHDELIANDLRAAKQPEARILEQVDAHDYPHDCRFAIKLALEEALTNAVKHGNRNDKSKKLLVRYYVDDERVVIAVRDEGCGFCPDNVPDPTADENLERPNGRGIMLMQAYMTRVWFNERGNEVWMLKLKHEAPQDATACDTEHA